MMSTIYFFIIGLACGSFSLVLAWRMHDKKDWVRGRSKCDSCHKELTATDLIPLFSWLSLKGRCRYCKKPIPATVPLAELFTGVVFAVSWAFWPYELSSFFGYSLLILWLVCCIIFSALFWYDAKWYILPNKLVYPLGYGAVGFTVIRYFVNEGSLYSDILLPVIAALALFGLFYILYQLSGGKWIGYGDVRLAIPIGLFVGTPILAWLMLFVASCIGILVALPGLLSGKKRLKSKLPFGPMLIIATIIVLLFGNEIVQLYTDNFLYL